MEKIVSFQQFTVWQEAHRLTLLVYRLTRQFPDEEKFGLISQMRRAAVSIPANIARRLQTTWAARQAALLQYSGGLAGGT